MFAFPRARRRALLLAATAACLPSLAQADDALVDAVVVTANRDPEDPPVVADARKRLSETPGAVAVVSAEAYRDRYAQGLSDTLRDVPGVFAQKKWGDDMRLSIRGSGIGNSSHNRGTLLAQDGVPFNEADGFGDFQQIDPLIARFTRAHPGPTVTLAVGNSRSMLEGLMETRIDVAVLADVPGDSRLYVLPLRRDPVRALVPKAHPLARRRAVALTDLATERLVLREPGSMTRRLIERALAAAEVTPAAIIEIQSREAVVEAVAAGLGIGFTSAAEFTGDGRLVLLPIAGAEVEMDEYVVCLRERRRLAVVRAFLDLAREVAAEAGGLSGAAMPGSAPATPATAGHAAPAPRRR